MKRLALCVMALAVVSAGWSQTLTLMNNGVVKFAAGEDQIRPYVGAVEMLVDRYAQTNGIKINMVYRDVSKGSLTFDAMLAAGNPPDVWIDAGGYMPNYMNDAYALQLEKYLDLSGFREDMISLWTRNGHVYAVPFVNIATGMAINTDMLKEIGYELPPLAQWTTDEFMRLAARLKAAGYPATMIMGKGGFNSWTDVWFYAHGATMFGEDKSRVAINSYEAGQALNFIRTVIDRGYTPAPLEVNDDDGVELFTTGKVFSCMMQNGHTDYWFPEQLKQGKIAKIPGYTFIEFPHATGRAHTPVSGYQTVVIAHKQRTEALNKLVAGLVGAVTGKEMQFYYATITGGFPTLKNFQPDIGAAALPSYKAIAGLASTAGSYKEWPDGPKYVEARRLWASMTEQWLRGKLTNVQLLSRFEAEANKILK